MDEDEEMQELRAQEARRVREEAKKCLRHASFQLGKAAYEIDEYRGLLVFSAISDGTKS